MYSSAAVRVDLSCKSRSFCRRNSPCFKTHPPKILSGKSYWSPHQVKILSNRTKCLVMPPLLFTSSSFIKVMYMPKNQPCAPKLSRLYLPFAARPSLQRRQTTTPEHTPCFLSLALLSSLSLTDLLYFFAIAPGISASSLLQKGKVEVHILPCPSHFCLRILPAKKQGGKCTTSVWI